MNVDIVRNGDERTYTVSLLNESGSTDVVKKGDSFYNSEFELMLQPINQNDMSRLNISSGLKIVEIRQGRFKNSGIPVDFVITKVNGVVVNDKTDLENAQKSRRSRRTTIEGVYPNGMNATFYYNN